VDITPPLGIPLIGSKGQPSDAILDELFAKSLVLSDGTNTVAIVSIELLYAPLEEIVQPVRALIEERVGIPGPNVMVCATHTHSGPEVFTRSKLPRENRMSPSQIDEAYLQTLIRKVADSVQLAHHNMQDVRIGAAMGSLPEVLFNRRPKANDGKVQMAFTLPQEMIATRTIEKAADGTTSIAFAFPSEEEPLDFGPVDPGVLALRVEDTHGAMVGSLIGFGCHPVCIYPYLSTTISADYPGFATSMVEQVEGGISLFVLGLAGNTVPLERGPDPCSRIGRALGAEALKRLQLVPVAADAALWARCREIVLPLEQASLLEDANATPTTRQIATEIQAMRIGKTCILGLPGEVLVEVGLKIRKRADMPELFIVTLANDAVGYICHEEAYEEGGYEPGAGTHLAEGAAEIMVEQALALIQEIG